MPLTRRLVSPEASFQLWAQTCPVLSLSSQSRLKHLRTGFRDAADEVVWTVSLETSSKSWLR
eukprot:1319219-Pyramimonas_sp.AAC.1